MITTSTDVCLPWFTRLRALPWIGSPGLLLLIACAAHAERNPVILIFGDSISAGYGMQPEQSWVSLLQQKLGEEDYDFQVVNASVSGETTGGGVTRIGKTLELHQPRLVILELGGNDGLRGYPIGKIAGNLQQMVETILASQADLLMIGMVLPPNYGKRYVAAFERSFIDIAAKSKVTLLPYLLDGVTTDRALLQRDGIHPTPDAQVLLLNDVWVLLEPMLLDLKQQRVPAKLQKPQPASVQAAADPAD